MPFLGSIYKGYISSDGQHVILDPHFAFVGFTVFRIHDCSIGVFGTELFIHISGFFHVLHIYQAHHRLIF